MDAGEHSLFVSVQLRTSRLGTNTENKKCVDLPLCLFLAPSHVGPSHGVGCVMETEQAGGHLRL